ncbi:hypothetical protein C8Q80DRAFT_1342590 [Daedaleopsis nitida]|nr:hypothetical protein C8Q80DRAFT_1342590 [Daedaleopsis nitida]
MSTHPTDTGDTSSDMISLATLPYDLLLNIAGHLELQDIYALQKMLEWVDGGAFSSARPNTIARLQNLYAGAVARPYDQTSCKALHAFSTTRPVYRNLAGTLLRRCRALPLHGFQRLSDLTDEQLIEAVNQATRLESAWLTRGPRPATSSPYLNPPDGTGNSTRTWYKVISAPPNEEVDWLSPITSSYSLCATKSGKVVCWDVHRDVCLAEWDPKERWELWKCRVEFDIRTVFFTMAKILQRSFDDRVMEFVLMKLEFPEEGEPVFSELATFKTIGVVMNVFLLDPSSRLLSAFVWVSSSNTIGLYALLDWDKEEYVFIDTGIECSMSSNWSCILYDEQIVIHSEESDVAHQYFYPIAVLQCHARPSSTASSFTPSISERLGPTTTMSAPFIFPPFSRSHSPAPIVDAHEAAPIEAEETVEELDEEEGEEEAPADAEEEAQNVEGEDVEEDAQHIAHQEPDNDGEDDQSGTVADANPFPYPPWYPESAHFVRQWWPTLASVPRLSCTVVLLAHHEQDTHRTRYVLAQHYFKVPLIDPEDLDHLPAAAAKAVADTHCPSPENAALHDKGMYSPTGTLSSSSSTTTTASMDHDWNADTSMSRSHRSGGAESSMMRLWYVSEPFEVVCVLDGLDDELDPDNSPERPRPLMAVDFGHAVWIEFTFPPETDRDEKRLRFVTFPPVTHDRDEMGYWEVGPNGMPGAGESLEGVVHTLDIPDELDLDAVETINIDQSQGAIIISVKDGKIFILCYE